MSSLVTSLPPSMRWMRLSRYMRPIKRMRRIEFGHLPKTISGKIRRVELPRLEVERLSSGSPARSNSGKPAFRTSSRSKPERNCHGERAANEGARLLEEGKALRAADIDLIWRLGYGWPDYRGGPMYFAGLMGLNNVVGSLERWSAAPDDQVSSLLVSLAADGGTLHRWGWID